MKRSSLKVVWNVMSIAIVIGLLAGPFAATASATPQQPPDLSSHFPIPPKERYNLPGDTHDYLFESPALSVGPWNDGSQQNSLLTNQAGSLNDYSTPPHQTRTTRTFGESWQAFWLGLYDRWLAPEIRDEADLGTKLSQQSTNYEPFHLADVQPDTNSVITSLVGTEDSFSEENTHLQVTPSLKSETEALVNTNKQPTLQTNIGAFQPMTMVVLADPYDEEPSTITNTIFFSNTVGFDYQDGSVILTPVSGTELCTDDQVVIYVTHPDGTQAPPYIWDYSEAGPGITCTPPVDLTYAFDVGLNTVSIELWDLIPPVRSSSSGYQLVSGPDVTGPAIEVIQLYGTKKTGTNGLSVSLLARIVDVGGGAVASQSVTISSGTVNQQLQSYPSTYHGPNVYSAVFTDVPDNTPIIIDITATDTNGNPAFAQATGYFSNGQFFGQTSCLNHSHLGYTLQSCNPVSTANGQKTERLPLLFVPGPGEADLDVTLFYNSNDVRLGIFGAAMSSDLETHIVPLYNPLVPGVEVIIGDGGRLRFNDNGDGTFSAASQGNEDTLIKDGSGYLYTTHDQRIYRFDDNGRLIERLDRNYNAITYAYIGDQLTSITTGNRTVTLAYNSDGYVESLSIAGKSIILTYDGDKLVDIEDAEGGHWVLEYETREIGEVIDERGEEFAYVAYNHLLTRVTTPEGRIKNEQSYDDQLRVTDQTSSMVGELRFEYIENPDGSSETWIYDIYDVPEIHYYNALGQIIQVTNRANDVERYFYNANFHVERKIDFNGENWIYDRDADGNIIEVYGPEGLRESWVYNEFNFPTFYRDGDGFEWSWEYDTQGNMVKATQPVPDGAFMTIAYDPRGLPIDIIDYSGNYIHNQYDPVNGDLIATKDGENPMGVFTQYEYDEYGRRVKMTLPLGNEWTYDYDLNDNLTDVFGPLTYHAKFQYDADDLLMREEDADTKGLTYVYDERGRLIELWNDENEPTFFTYGPMNELKTVENAREAITTYSHDDKYRVVQIDMPENVTLLFDYDGLDNVTFATDGEGRVTATTYDGLSRPFALVQNYIENVPMSADTNVVTLFEHDYRRNVVKIINPLTDELEFEYDSVGRLRWTENEENERTWFEYDGNGNRTAVQYPEGNRVETAYNGRNQPSLITDGGGFEFELLYDANGNLTDMVDPDTITMHYEYNPLDQRITQTANYVLGGGIGSDLNVFTQYFYSLAGDLTKVIDAEDFVFEFFYDDAHRLIQEVNPEGEIDYIYDDIGNMVERIDANDHSWTYDYDLLDRLTAVTNPENHAFTYQYDKASNMTLVTDARLYETTTEYDALNRPIRLENASDYITEFEYDELGNMLSLTDGNLHTTQFEYDKAQRMTARIDAEGYRVEFEYDDNGRQTLRRIPYADPSQTIEEQFEYDRRDLLTATINGENERTEYGYNSVGLLETQTENDGIVTFYGYDGLRRLNQVTLNYQDGAPAVGDINVTYNYLYDRVGNLDAVTDPLGHTTSFDYNGLGSLIFEENPIGNQWVYDYDPVQNLTYRLDGNGEETFYSYYEDDQLQLIDYPDDPDVSYLYDPNNNPTEMQDSLGTTFWGYDPLNRLVDVTDSLGRNLHYDFDALNRTAITYPDGRSVSYTYLDNDWMETVTDPTGGVSQYSYDEAGRMTGIDNPTATYTTRSYDRANRLLHLGNYQDGGDILSQFVYQYDDVGQRTQVTETYGWRQPDTVTEDYTYDGLRRLTGVADSEGLVMSYVYDRASNRTLWQTNDDPFGNSPNDGFTATYSYNEANQLLSASISRTPTSQSGTISFAYDGNGNRFDKLVEGNGADRGMAYIYDDENRLVSAHSYLITGNGNNINWQAETTMGYDGNGRRLVETYDPHAPGAGGQKRTEYVFDGLDPVAEYDLWNNHQRNYYRGAGNQLIQLHFFPSGSQGRQYWYHHDGLGSVAGLTKQHGQSTHNYRYDAYGGVVPANGNWLAPHNEYALTEKAYDDHTGLYYFGARYYDSETAVWISPDTYRGELVQPLSLHRTLYVEGNPVNYVDLYGWAKVTNNSNTTIFIASEDDPSKLVELKPGQSGDADGIYQNSIDQPRFIDASPNDVVLKLNDWMNVTINNTSDGKNITWQTGIIGRFAGWLDRFFRGDEGWGWKGEEFIQQYNWAAAPTKTIPPFPPTQPRSNLAIVNPENYSSCAKYAQARRPDLGKVGGDGGAANYINRPGVFQIADKATDLSTKISIGDAIIWPRQHSDTVGTAGYTYGHIAIVEAVESNKILVSQSNWGNQYEMWIDQENLNTLYILPY